MKINKITNRELWLNNVEKMDINDSGWIRINILPWGGNYKPLTLAAISYDDSGFNVYMKSYEPTIRFEGTLRNDPVHLDSCMEFFFSPVEDSKAYLNFEINPLGTLYTGYSFSGLRKDSKPVCKDLSREYFNIKSMTKEDAENYNKNKSEDKYWDISFSVPFDYIKKMFPDFILPETLKANFYKCGDLTENEHYVVWNNIELPSPDFHRPEFFGTLEL